MVSKAIVTVLLIVAIILSVSATYTTITSFSVATVDSNSDGGNLGVNVKPARSANVGLIVLPDQPTEEP